MENLLNCNADNGVFAVCSASQESTVTSPISSPPKVFSIDDYKITAEDHLDFQVDKGDYPDATFHPEDLRVGSELEVARRLQRFHSPIARHQHYRCSFNDNVRVKRTAVIENTAPFWHETGAIVRV